MISEQFKSLNLKKNEKVMHRWNKRGQNEEKWGKKKHILQLKKLFFFLLLSFGCSFGFAFQRWFAEIEKLSLYHFKSLKKEKNWEKSVKVFSDNLVFGDRRIYPYCAAMQSPSL
jgi:hypothetical protein